MEEAFTIAKGMPKPRTQREARNMSLLRAPAWRPAPMHIMREAMRIVRRRPRYWEMVGMKGIAMRAPREYIALRRPRREEVGLSKSIGGSPRQCKGCGEGIRGNVQSVHDLTAWRLFIIELSNPEVHSTPRPVGTRIRYRKRRLGFLYQGMSSACAMRVSRGSACSSLAPMMAILVMVVAALCLALLW